MAERLGEVADLSLPFHVVLLGQQAELVGSYRAAARTGHEPLRHGVEGERAHELERAGKELSSSPDSRSSVSAVESRETKPSRPRSRDIASIVPVESRKAQPVHGSITTDESGSLHVADQAIVLDTQRCRLLPGSPRARVWIARSSCLFRQLGSRALPNEQLDGSARTLTTAAARRIVRLG
jgi:hypothetical protein